MSYNGDFYVLDQLGLWVPCSLLLGVDLGFGDAANAGKSKTRAKDSKDLAFLWHNEQGIIVLKNILTAGNSEASDEGVGLLAGEGEITARSHSPNGRKFWEGSHGGGLKIDMPSGVM
jgi:hypothetical protein